MQNKKKINAGFINKISGKILMIVIVAFLLLLVGGVGFFVYKYMSINKSILGAAMIGGAEVAKIDEKLAGYKLTKEQCSQYQQVYDTVKSTIGIGSFSVAASPYVASFIIDSMARVDSPLSKELSTLNTEMQKNGNQIKGKNAEIWNYSISKINQDCGFELK